MEFSAQMIAGLIGGTIEGNPDAKVNNFAKIEEGKPGCISFLANDKYEHYIYETQSSVVLVNNNFEPKKEVSATLIRVPDAREAVAKLLLPVFLPFNLLKGCLNAGFTCLLYKPVMTALRKSGYQPMTVRGKDKWDDRRTRYGGKR